MTAQDVLTLRVTLLRAGYSPIPLFGKVPPAYGKNNARKGPPVADIGRCFGRPN